jgi:hypothetical protein
MGIKKLFTFLDNNNMYKLYPFINDLILDLKLDKNKLFIGIDGNLYCYKYSHSYDNMLIGFYNQIVKFLSNGIYPFYIFDGGTLIEKENTNMLRNHKKNVNKIKLEKIEEEIKINDDEKLLIIKKKIEKHTIRISSTQINKLIDLLDIMNIPYLFSHGEGEYLAVLLNKYNIIDMFLSDDTDPIPAGINKIIKFYSNNVLYLNTSDIYTNLNITNDQLCDFSILLGTDYAVFHHGIKPEELLKLIIKYNNIETIIDNIKINIFINNQPLDDNNKNEFLVLVNKIRNIYKKSYSNEKILFINPNTNPNNYNIISNIKNINTFSNTLLEFWDNFIDILSIDEIDNDNILNKSNDFKHNIIKYIKHKKFNVKNIIKFLKDNVNDITNEELTNATISFNYLNEFN